MPRKVRRRWHAREELHPDQIAHLCYGWIWFGDAGGLTPTFPFRDSEERRQLWEKWREVLMRGQHGFEIEDNPKPWPPGEYPQAYLDYEGGGDQPPAASRRDHSLTGDRAGR